MQLDYQQFLIKVQKLMTLRPMPERELVDERVYHFAVCQDTVWNRKLNHCFLGFSFGYIEIN